MSNDINNPSNETTRFEEAKHKVTSFVKRNKNVILTSTAFVVGALATAALTSKNSEEIQEHDDVEAELERPSIVVGEGPDLMVMYTDTNEFDQRDAYLTLKTLREKGIVDEDFDMNDYWNVEDYV